MRLVEGTSGVSSPIYSDWDSRSLYFWLVGALKASIEHCKTEEELLRKADIINEEKTKHDRIRELKHFKIYEEQNQCRNGNHLQFVDAETILERVYATMVDIFMKLDAIFTLYSVNKICSVSRVTVQSAKNNY